MISLVESTERSMYLNVDTIAETMVCSGSLQDAQWLSRQNIPDFKGWKFCLSSALEDIQSCGTVRDFRIEVGTVPKITASITFEGEHTAVLDYTYPKTKLSVVE